MPSNTIGRAIVANAIALRRRLKGWGYCGPIDGLENRRLFSTVALTAIPQLNSNPTAPATLYLNFTGAPAAQWGGYSAAATPAYDIDGDPTTFADAEIANIREIWARVAEKFSPFNLNVTTVAPSALNHGTNFEVIVGGNGAWAGTVGEVGIAYVGSFASIFEPDSAYTFSAALGGDPHGTAEDIAHEAGHAFGLEHHPAWDGNTLVSGYSTSTGTPGVAPIMGNSLASTRGVWWNGSDTDGPNVLQDDMAVISNATNGFGYRGLTVGQTAGTATPLSISSGSVSGSGIIESTAQTDYYSFNTGAGTDTFTVNVAQYGAMLHAKLLLLDSNGNTLATAADANTLGQTITSTLAAGNYYLVVESYGQYGDVGQYTLSGSVVPPPGGGGSGPSNPALAIAGAASVNERAVYTLNLSASDPGHTISGWSINWGDGNTQSISWNPSSVTHTYAAGPNVYIIQATATDDTGTYAAGNPVAVSVTHVPPTLSITGAASIDEGSIYTLSLRGSDPGHTIQSWSINWGDGSAAQLVTGNATSVTHVYLSAPVTPTIVATATDDVGTYSAANTVALTVNAVPATVPPPPSIGTWSAGGRAVVSNTLSTGGQDVRTLTLTQPQILRFVFAGQRPGFAVQVTDDAGNPVVNRSARGFAATMTLGPGTYTAMVSSAGTSAAKYRLTTTARPVAARVAAAGLATATSGGAYWFTLPQPKSVTLNLVGRQDVVEMILTDLDGNVLLDQTTRKLSTQLTLPAGSYHVQVIFAGQQPTRYTLSTINRPASVGRGTARAL